MHRVLLDRMALAPDVYARIERLTAKELPFNVWLGVRVDDLDDGGARLSIPFRPELIGDPARHALHGGVISTLMDTCAGAAAWTKVGRDERVATVDLRIDYLRPGRAETLIAEARVVRSGRRLAVVGVRAFHPDDPDEPIAEARGVYSIRRQPAGASDSADFESGED